MLPELPTCLDHLFFAHGDHYFYNRLLLGVNSIVRGFVDILLKYTLYNNPRNYSWENLEARHLVISDKGHSVNAKLEWCRFCGQGQNTVETYSFLLVTVFIQSFTICQSFVIAYIIYFCKFMYLPKPIISKLYG